VVRRLGVGWCGVARVVGRRRRARGRPPASLRSDVSLESVC